MSPVQTFTILVVSDETHIGNTLRNSAAGRLKVVVTPNLEQGLDRVSRDYVAAVLVNLGTPDLNSDDVSDEVRRFLGDIPVIGYQTNGEHTQGSVISQDALNELSRLLDNQVSGVNFTPPSPSTLLQQTAEARPPQKSHMPTVFWPKLPLQVEETLSMEMLAMLLQNQDRLSLGDGGTSIGGAAVVASGGVATTSAVEPLTQSPPIILSPNGLAHGGNGSLPKPLGNGTHAPSAPAEPTPASTFLRDEAAVLEQANEFEVLDGTQRRLTGRVRRVSSNFLVGEVIAQAKFQPTDWNSSELAIRFGTQVVYRGPARLLKLVNTGNSMICEWALQGDWQRPSTESLARQTTTEVFSPFLDRIRLLGRISDVFKAMVAEVATVLGETKQALDRLEVTVQPSGDETQADAMRRLFPELQITLFPVLTDVFSRFERACAAVPAELDAQHHMLVRQYLHPYLLTSPFIEHIYAKPLGYAGDYGALQRLLGEPWDGPTLFAKLINAWLVLTPAGEAYRHRIQVLTNALHHQAAACQRQGRPLRVLSLGCGAATEIARFVSSDDLSEGAEFTLVDFNDVTLAEAELNVRQAAETSWRQVRHRTINRNIQNLVADDTRMVRRNEQAHGDVVRSEGYDLVHCTGLFDYFSDRVCERLMQMLYRVLAPGGTLVVCNFTPDNTIRHFMRLALDWKLIHRTAQQLRALAPQEVSGEHCRISLSHRGVEAYLQITKPAAAASPGAGL